MANRFTIRLIAAAWLLWQSVAMALATDPAPVNPKSGQPSTPRAEDANSPSAKKSASEAKRKPPIAVAIETTHILQPLQADGSPDYLAALNEHARHGTTPQNNAAVQLWQAFGPEIVPSEIDSEYTKLLGSKPLAPGADYFVICNEMAQRWLKGAPSTHDDDQDDDNLQSQFATASAQPWSAKDYPMVAQWLQLNETPLRLLTQAAQRPQFFEPMVSPSKNLPAITNVVQPSQQTIVNFKLAFEARAMLHLKAVEIDAAWDDLIACHRLLRRMASMPLVRYDMDLLNAENDLCQTELMFLHSAHLAVKPLQRMQAEWAALAPPPSLADRIDLGSRYRFLLDQHGQEGLQQLLGDAFAVNDETALRKAVADPQFDWNEPLRLGNQWYDRQMAISRIADRHQRDLAMEQLQGDLAKMAEETSAASILGLNWFTRKSARAALGRRAVGELLKLEQFDNDLEEFGSALQTEDQHVIHMSFMQIGFALAAYRAEHGEYPQRLEALTPKYLAKLPHDLYGASGVLHYRRQVGGYRLYSVGPNGLDEQSNNAERYYDSDDIAVSITDPTPMTHSQATD
jgi:hypothetical protein